MNLISSKAVREIYSVTNYLILLGYVSCNLSSNRYSKESRGYAFVRFYDKRDAEDAMDRLDGTVLDGREIRIQLARYGRPTDGRRGDRRRRSR